MTMNDNPLDHGVLNVPLAKRGNLDGEIERNVAQQRAAGQARAREARESLRARRRRALAALEQVPVGAFKRFAAKTGKSVAEVRRFLRSNAGINPDTVFGWAKESTPSESIAT